MEGSRWFIAFSSNASIIMVATITLSGASEWNIALVFAPGVRERNIEKQGSVFTAAWLRGIWHDDWPCCVLVAKGCGLVNKPCYISRPDKGWAISRLASAHTADWISSINQSEAKNYEVNMSDGKISFNFRWRVSVRFLQPIWLTNGTVLARYPDPELINGRTLHSTREYRESMKAAH